MQADHPFKVNGWSVSFLELAFYFGCPGINAFGGFVTFVKIVGREYQKLVQFFDMLSELSEAQDVDFYFTISCDKEDLPVEVFDYCEEL